MAANGDQISDWGEEVTDASCSRMRVLVILSFPELVKS